MNWRFWGKPKVTPVMEPPVVEPNPWTVDADYWIEVHSLEEVALISKGYAREFCHRRRYYDDDAYYLDRDDSPFYALSMIAWINPQTARPVRYAVKLPVSQGQLERLQQDNDKARRDKMIRKKLGLDT